MITQPNTPVLIDAFLVEFNTKIVSLLPWLNNPLGKVQGVTRDGRVVPAMFTNGKEYGLEVWPSDTLSNFSWFVFGKEQLTQARRQARITVPASFNLFLDLRKVYPLVTQSRDIENAKSEIVTALKTITLLTGSLSITEVSESFDDVYEGFSLSETEDKYFMQPFAGLNFKLDVILRNTTVC